MGRIRILDIASTDQGAYRLLRTRVEKINIDENYENFIVCPAGEWQEKIKDIGVKCINFDVTRGLATFKVFKEIKQLEKILKESKPDVVHSHNSKTGALARLAVRNVNKTSNKKIKMVHQVHGYHFTTYSGFKRKIFLGIEKYLAKSTDILLFQNKYEMNLSKQEKMDEKAKLVYIGNGINIEEFEELIQNKEIIESNNTIKIVCVARIEPVKNHKMLIEALNILKNNFNVNYFKAILIGEGKSLEINELISKYKLEENIVFTGALDRKDVIKTIESSHISVLTSLKEGKPRALIESSLLGKPCIGTNVVGTNEVIIDGETGYLVELYDSKSFAEKIDLLIKDKELYNKFSLNAKEFAYKEFNEDTVIEEIKGIYKRVCVGGK